MIRYATTIFLSAFLLFQVQPLIARVILPWFGGSASVWTTCMMFFQIVLVAGYLYSHGLRRLFTPRTGWLIHVALLLLAGLNLFLLPLIPGDWLKPTGDENLTVGILTVLGLSVGVPFFVLSTTGPLIQAWQSVTSMSSTEEPSSDGQTSTYRLYAVSNVGSILALLTYPFLFEPNFTLAQQGFVWTILFVSFCCLCFSSGMQIKPGMLWTSHSDDQSNEHENPVSIFRIGIWLLLSMAPSIMLLATTNLMCQQIASVPFLWIVPLSLYLLSFIICFDRPALYRRWLFGPLMVLSVFIGIAIVHMHIYVSAPLQILGLCLVCFSTSMSCHGELERVKPPTKHLTLFYLCVAIGGSLGGIFVVVVSPTIFNDFYEFQVGLIIVAFLSCLTPLVLVKQRNNWHWIYVMVGLFAAAVPVASLMHQLDPNSVDGLVMKGRNEYGLTSVIDHQDFRSFVSGKIDHGTQKHQPDKKFEPSGYYTKNSGIAIAIQGQRMIKPTADKNLDVGVIGLGIGAMLAWCEGDDRFTFYEINSAVKEIAENYFTFLSQYADQTEVVIGDGRIQLENHFVIPAQKSSMYWPPTLFPVIRSQSIC